MNTIERSLLKFLQKEPLQHKPALLRVLRDSQHLLTELQTHSSEDIDCINEVLQEIAALKFVINKI